MRATKLAVVERDLMNTTERFLERVEEKLVEISNLGEVKDIDYTSDKVGSLQVAVITYVPFENVVSSSEQINDHNENVESVKVVETETTHIQ